MELLPLFVNHRAPSGPPVIPFGDEIPWPVKYEIVPAVVILPIELFPVLVNHRAPSGPVAMPEGELMPRALLLTLLLRSFACDLFVHGLGGEIYDPAMEAWVAPWVKRLPWRRRSLRRRRLSCRSKPRAFLRRRR